MLLRSLNDCLPRPEVIHPVLLLKTKREKQEREREKDPLMELKTQTELDVSGDRYNDLLHCAECEAVNVYGELQQRYS